MSCGREKLGSMRYQNEAPDQPEQIMNKTVLICLVLLVPGQARADSLPLNPAVTPETINQTICVHGWTNSVRPPVSRTSAVKRRMMVKIGVPPEGEPDITLDHCIPLALGGAPDDPQTFMLQPDDESKDKDRVEVCLARTVCAGWIDLASAQMAIWLNWKTAGRLCSGYKVMGDD